MSLPSTSPLPSSPSSPLPSSPSSPSSTPIVTPPTSTPIVTPPTSSPIVTSPTITQSPRHIILSIDIGIRNLGVCLLEYAYQPPCHDWKQLTVHHMELVDMVQVWQHLRQQKSKRALKPTTSKNAKTINIHELCQVMIHIFARQTEWLKHVTDIRVEQQPISRGRGAGNSCGSIRMKIMQHCLMTFFETYYTLHPELKKPVIGASSPANKLRCVIEQHCFATPPLDETDKNSDYKQRKAKAVVQFNKLIQWCNVNPVMRQTYQDMKKQNDIADCVLQAVYELQQYASSYMTNHLSSPTQTSSSSTQSRKRKR